MHGRAGLLGLVLTQLSATVRINDFFRGERAKTPLVNQLNGTAVPRD